MFTDLVRVLALAAPLATTFLGAATLVRLVRLSIQNWTNDPSHRTQTAHLRRRCTPRPSTADPTSTPDSPRPTRPNERAERNFDVEPMGNPARFVARVKPMPFRMQHPPPRPVPGSNLPAPRPPRPGHPPPRLPLPLPHPPQKQLPRPRRRRPRPHPRKPPSSHPALRPVPTTRALV